MQLWSLAPDSSGRGVEERRIDSDERRDLVGEATHRIDAEGEGSAAVVHLALHSRRRNAITLVLLPPRGLLGLGNGKFGERRPIRGP